MKNQISVARLNVSQAALLSGKTRETVSRATRELQSVNGASNAKFFDSRKLLQALYLGVVGPTYSEAMRLLTLSRKDLIDHELEEKKARTVPIEQYRHDFQHLIALFRASLLSRMGKVVDSAFVDGCQKELQDYLISTEPEESARTAMRKALCEKAIEEADMHIKYLKAQVARDKWRAEYDAASQVVREAYLASQSDKTQAAVDRLVAAREAGARIVQPPM